MTDDLNEDWVLTLTDAAAAKVVELRASEPDGDTLALWIEVSGTNDDSYTYDMYFQAAVDAGPDDWAKEQGDLLTIVPAASVPKMTGSVLDVEGEGAEAGMSIRNPNRPPARRASPSISGPLTELTGDVAQRIIQVLDQQVNPSIAAHGGHAELVAVEDDAAYLRLSGGCAGCGMASVTLSQGIEVAIRDSVPEIVRVVDVTDHASGDNPYYEAAKK